MNHPSLGSQKFDSQTGPGTGTLPLSLLSIRVSALPSLLAPSVLWALVLKVLGSVDMVWTLAPGYNLPLPQNPGSNVRSLQAFTHMLTFPAINVLAGEVTFGCRVSIASCCISSPWGFCTVTAGPGTAVKGTGLFCHRTWQECSWIKKLQRSSESSRKFLLQETPGSDTFSNALSASSFYGSRASGQSYTWMTFC